MTTRPKVGPRITSPSHTISLSDGVEEWGLILKDGVRGIQESPQTPSTLLTNKQGGQFGDFDPSQSHIEQSEWSGGRGNEKFSDDITRYFDSKNAWTLTQKSLLPSLQWKHAIGDRGNNTMPLGDTYDWKALIGTSYSATTSFTTATAYTTTKIYLWVKRVGNPGTMTVELRSSVVGEEPGTVYKTATLAASGLEKGVIYNKAFTWGGGGYALGAATQYHIVAYGAAGDNPANHWEIMTVYDTTTSVKAYHYNGAAWLAWNYKIYHRVIGADVDQYWLFFYYKNKQYAVSVPATGNSKLYYFTSTTNPFTSNSGPDQVMTEVTTTGLTVVTDVCVSNGAVYFAQGASTNIRRWNGTTWADDGTNKATYLLNYTDPGQGPVIWRALGYGVSKAPIVAWGTNLTFGTTIAIGEGGDGSIITGMCGYNDSLWVIKANSIWAVRLGRASKLDVGLDDVVNYNTGRASSAHGLYFFFSYATSLERLYQSSLDDVGPGHGAGLPDDRTGAVSALESVFGLLFAAIDGGTANYSSVLVYDGINYHEVWRAPEAGRRIRAIFWQAGVNNGYPILWVDYGGDIVFIKFPRFGFNVIRDVGMYFCPDAHLVTSTIDFNATRLPKIFKELTLITQNLAVSTNKTKRVRSAKITHNSKISVDYQCDDDIGSSTWIDAGDIFTSPSAIVPINEGNRYAIRFRIRIQTSDAANPPIINATVLEGVARTPIKYQWVIRAKLSSIQSTLNGTPDHNPDELLAWLQNKAGSAETLIMRSVLKTMDGKIVMADPPSTLRDFADPVTHAWGGSTVIVLREA